MKRHLQMNEAMKSLINQKHPLRIQHPNYEEMASEIADFIQKLALHRQDEKTWIVPVSEPYRKIQHKFQTLTEYECYCNELYFGKTIIMELFSEAVRYILDKTTRELLGAFPELRFVIWISAQYGEYANITVKIHLYRREEFEYNQSLEGFAQPVLYEVLYT